MRRQSPGGGKSLTQAAKGYLLAAGVGGVLPPARLRRLGFQVAMGPRPRRQDLIGAIIGAEGGPKAKVYALATAGLLKKRAKAYALAPGNAGAAWGGNQRRGLAGHGGECLGPRSGRVRARTPGLSLCRWLAKVTSDRALDNGKCFLAAL